MKTVSDISREITTTITEKFCGDYDVVCTHISGEQKSMTCSRNVEKVACVIQADLISRIVNKMEMG